MAHTAVVVFTARPLQEIVVERGSGDWRLDADRARRSQYLVCTQNRHNPDFGAPAARHGAAFLVGRISDVVPSAVQPDRWVIKISEYLACDIPNIWARSGQGRYPVRYSTLEALEIDLDALPAFSPVPQDADAPPRIHPDGVSEAPARLLTPTAIAFPQISSAASPLGSNDATRRLVAPDPWQRLDAILGQLDRVPELRTAVDPLDWDDHGLPQ